MSENFYEDLKQNSDNFYSEYQRLMKTYNEKNKHNKLNQENEAKKMNLNSLKQALEQNPKLKEQLLKKIQSGELSEQDVVDFLNSNLNTPKKEGEIDSEGGKVIIPEPLCCVKCFDDKGEKVFINITIHEDILPPAEEHILEADSQLGIRIPLSLSEKKEDFDVNNKICMVYDVIFSSKIKLRIEEELAFIVALICERIRQRFTHQIFSDKFVKLKNSKYKGASIQSQRVKIKNNKIKEVLNPKNNEMKSIVEKELEKVTQSLIHPEYQVYLTTEKMSNRKDVIKFSKRLIDFYLENNRAINKDMFKQFFSNIKIKNIENNKSESFYSEVLPFLKTINYSKYSSGFVFIIYMPLITKSFAVNIKLRKQFFVLMVPNIYYLEVSLPYQVNKNKVER